MKVPNKVEILKFFNSDRAILITCIFIALVFWLLVKLSQTFYTTADFQINYKLPVGKSFITSPPISAKATLKGTGWDLVSYQFEKGESTILFEINDVASQAINGSLLIDKFQQTISPAIEVSDVNMDFIFVQMENETKIKVPVKLIQNIKLATQFQLMDSINLAPDSIFLTGPSTEVNSIKYWETEMLELHDLAQNQAIVVSLKTPGNTEIHLSEDKVAVDIQVEQFTEKSFFLPITIKNAPDSLKTFPERAKLSCLVGLSKFNDVDRSAFELVADLQGIPLNTEKNTIPVQLTKKPDFVHAVNFQPRSVEFFFVETEKETEN